MEKTVKQKKLVKQKNRFNGKFGLTEKLVKQKNQLKKKWLNGK